MSSPPSAIVTGSVRSHDRKTSKVIPRQTRRLLTEVFVGVILAAPLAAEAQPAGKVYRLGFLQQSPNTPAMNFTEAFRQGLRDHGYVEGQNLVIEHRMSSAPKENPALLADLVSRKVDVIVTWSTPALVAAKKATSTIPIVGISGDPVQTGLVASLARPGGNLTGLSILSEELEPKNLQLLKEIVPGSPGWPSSGIPTIRSGPTR